jgi:Ca2+-binding RTX toxin-like protein
MPQLITAHTSTVVALSNGEDIYVFAGAGIAVTFGPAISGASNNAYKIDGYVFGNDTGIVTSPMSTTQNITIGSTGTVAGFISGGIFLFGSAHAILNRGEITGAEQGVVLATIGDEASSVVNYGLISGGFSGISRLTGEASATPLEKVIVKNFGTIIGGTFSFSDHLPGFEPDLVDAVEEITNNGQMIGDVGLGLGNDLYDGRKGTIDGDVFGGAGNDRLYGGVDDDRLDGGTGNDVLMGGAGADALIGRNGTDTVLYTSAKSGVTVNLAKPNLNTGDASGDTFSSIENLTGSRFNDKMTGNSGGNVIDGGDGADRMEGGAGNDRYIVDNAGDVVIEANGGGTDRVVSNVSFTLGQFIEQLTLSGSDNISGTGNSLANTITGNAGNNTLNGSGGNDTLSGAAGNDVLNGGTGNDTMTGGNGGDFFVFNTALNASTNVDTITDFSVTADTIRIDNAVFAGLANGSLAAGAFTANTSGNAGDASDRIIYETDTGRLFFDADGTGAGAKIRFGTLDPGLALTNADFVVI